MSRCSFKPEWLSELRACGRCALAGTRTQVVAGEGPTNALVMFVGEAPGAEEDQTGRPFVGMSGKLLRETWQEIDEGRTPIYIANTVKCRPPANRRPRPGEVDACRAWLEEEVRVVNPRVVVALGRTASAALLPATAKARDWMGWRHASIGDWSGLIASAWHPAAVLRSRNARMAPWRGQLTIVARVAHGEVSPDLRS